MALGLEKVTSKTRLLRRMFNDPTKGIEYNNIVPNRRVSRLVYGFDIARNPQIVSNTFEFINVSAEACEANSMRDMVDAEARKMRGRSI